MINKYMDNLVDQAIGSQEKNAYLLVSETITLTSFAAICGYGGTFLLTKFNPALATTYFGSVALVSFVVYKILEEFKNQADSDLKKYIVTGVQLLQIPIFFYLSHGLVGPYISGADKLEMIKAVAHFVAIPLFFDQVIKAWSKPQDHMGTVAALLLPLADGLYNYSHVYKG